MILQRPLTNEYNNVVRLFCKSAWSVYKPIGMCKILMAVVAFLCTPINSTFLDCDLLPLILIYVTVSAKTVLNGTFIITGKTDLKYSRCCGSVVLDFSHARFTV